MGTFRNYLISKNHTAGGIATSERHLYHFINWCEDENIETEQASHTEILSYIAHIKRRGIKQITVQKYMGSLKHYFTWLVKRKVREENPVRNINIKGVKRNYLYDVLKKQELENLYESFEVPTKNKASQLASKRNKVMLGLMIWQGLGSKELSRIEEKDLQLRDGKIYITSTRKSNERTLKLESVQILDLMEYQLQIRKEILELRTNESEKLFISVGGSDLFHNIMSKLMQKLNQQNPRITSAKQIRTSVITHWLKNYNLRDVQYMAGHRYVSSTESYLINDLEDLQEDIAKFHPIG